MALEAQEVVIRARLAGGNAVKAEAERVEASIKKIGEAGAAVNAEGAGGGLTGFFGKAGKSADAMAGKMDSLSKKSLQLGRQTAVLSAGAAGLIYESVKAYSSFGASTTLLQTQAGATEAQRKALEKGATAFGKFGYSGKEVAEALYPVQSVIKNTNKDLAIMKAAAMGAAVGHETLANTADALTSAVASGTIGVHGYVEEMNLLHLAVGAGKMHLPTLVEMFNTRIFPTASSMGINQRAILGLLAGVSQTVGESGAVSYASVFRTLLSKLMGMKGQALKAAKSLGLNEHTLQDESREGPFGMVKVLQSLRSSMGRVGLDKWQKAVNEMFGGSRSASTMLTAIQVLPAIERATGTLANERGTAAFERAFAQVQKTPAQQFKVMKAEGINALIELGKALTPTAVHVLHDMLDIVKTLSGVFKSLPTPVKDAMVGLLAFSALLAPGAFLFAGITGAASLAFKLAGGLSTVAGALVGGELSGAGFLGAIGLITAGTFFAAKELHLFGENLANTNAADKRAREGKFPKVEGTRGHFLLEHPFDISHLGGPLGLSAFNRAWLIKELRSKRHGLDVTAHEPGGLTSRENTELRQVTAALQALGDRPIHTHVHLDGRQIAEEVERRKHEHNNRR